MGSLGQDLANLYARELDRLAGEIVAYENDADLWSTIGSQKNPPGALALHVVGGLLAMIGAALGATGYVRDRDGEFSGRGVPRDAIAGRIRECRDIIVPILEGLDEVALASAYPGRLPDRLRGGTTRALLLHLLWHIGWHQGHIYYHRLGIVDPGSGPGTE